MVEIHGVQLRTSPGLSLQASASLTPRDVNTASKAVALARIFAFPNRGAFGLLLRRNDCFCIKPVATAAIEAK